MEGSVLLSRVHETMHISIHPKKSVTITVNRLSLHMFEDEFTHFAQMILTSESRLSHVEEGLVAQFDKGRVIRTMEKSLNVSFLSINFTFSDEGYKSFLSLIKKAVENYEEHFKEDTIDDDILAFLNKIEKADYNSPC